MNEDTKETLIAGFSTMFPDYRLEESDDEGFKLLRINAIRAEGGREDVWIATVYEMGELFILMELNRTIVNERLGIG